MAELELWGAPAEVIAAQEQPENEAGEAIEVWPENWDIVVAFLAIATQWRVVSLTTLASVRLYYIGLDYAAARMGLAAERIRVTPGLWAGIRIMECTAREVLNR